MIHSVASLRCAIAATASCHVAHRLSVPDMFDRSTYLRVRAMELLRSELDTGTDYARLYCAIVLAQLDVCEHILVTEGADLLQVCSGGSCEFDVHLRAATALAAQHDSSNHQQALIEQRLLWWVLPQLYSEADGSGSTLLMRRLVTDSHTSGFMT